MSETKESRYDLYRLAKKQEANGRYDEALESYAQAIKASADYAHAWFYKSRLHYNLHQYREARSYAKRALELAPGWEKHISTIIKRCDFQLKS